MFWPSFPLSLGFPRLQTLGRCHAAFTCLRLLATISQPPSPEAGRKT
jgi:hypothetical protein